MIALVFAITVASTASSTSASEDIGDAPSSAIRPSYTSTTGFRLNPLGLFTDFRVGLTKPLSRSQSPLFKGTTARVEGLVLLTPATASLGVNAYIQPVNLLRLGVAYTPTHYWGTFNSLQSFASPLDDYAPSRLGDRDGYARWVHQISLTGVLQMRIGDVALRNTLVAAHVSARLRNNDALYYDYTWDVLVPRKSWVFQNDTDVLYFASPRWTVGLRHTLVTLKYDESLDAGGQNNVPTSRLGPVVLYKLSTNTTGKMREPTLFLIVSWWLENRYRTGEDVTQLLPYILGGINFEGW